MPPTSRTAAPAAPGALLNAAAPAGRALAAELLASDGTLARCYQCRDTKPVATFTGEQDGEVHQFGVCNDCRGKNKARRAEDAKVCSLAVHLWSAHHAHPCAAPRLLCILPLQAQCRATPEEQAESVVTDCAEAGRGEQWRSGLLPRLCVSKGSGQLLRGAGRWSVDIQGVWRLQGAENSLEG